MTDSPVLHQFETIPDGLTSAPAWELWRVLPGPSLIHLPGRRPEPLLVSVLQHGQETTGLLAVQALLEKYRSTPLPRSLSLLFGNIQAARWGVRRLDDQVDYNRAWPGTETADCAETRLCAEVVGAMERRGVFASIDVHNNTGTNPHYACVNRLDPRFLQLAALFSRLVIHFSYPRGTQSAAFARLCPAVTLECGKPEQPYGIDHAFSYLDACLHLAEIPCHPVAAGDIDLFASVAQVTVQPQARFGFHSAEVDLQLWEDIDHLNFTEIAAGTALGIVHGDWPGLPVVARNGDGLDVTDAYFSRSGELLVTSRAVMPSMLTPDERVIRQDCLCYLMERLVLDRTAASETHTA
ncbi:MAG: peptidase M14 [Methylococcaceae bacterium]|nr:peptidase M14 [Methylococcaceae bacterium]